ncbi:MAG: hypothetical protein AB8B47_09460 [Roseobacter sp.]
MASIKQTANLADVLNSVSAHLDLLAGQVFEVEDALGDVLKDQTSGDHLSITKFQTLDYARQSLEDCALLLHLLSTQSGPSAVTLNDHDDIARRLKLDVTKSLCSKQSISSSPAAPSAGEMDLF